VDGEAGAGLGELDGVFQRGAPNPNVSVRARTGDYRKETTKILTVIFTQKGSTFEGEMTIVETTWGDVDGVIQQR
jgi:hypothetical protein